MKLNLGACDRDLPGFQSVDIVPPADIVTDLALDWPWTDSSIDEVFAADIFEHLPDKIHTMNELWRVLRGGGRATIEVPSAVHGAGAFQDPTHVSFWCANSFEYHEQGNINRERFRNRNGVKGDFRVLHLQQYDYNGKWDPVRKVKVILEALK